jgi:hypothetical protein
MGKTSSDFQPAHKKHSLKTMRDRISHACSKGFVKFHVGWGLGGGTFGDLVFVGRANKSFKKRLRVMCGSTPN